MLLSLTGNFLVVAVFFRNKTLRTPVHYFIMNMAVSDLIIPVVVLPWKMVEAWHDRVWLVDGVLDSILCKLLPIAWYLSINMSVCNMVVIATERLHAVIFHMRPPL